jgi:hypothetical protein
MKKRLLIISIILLATIPFVGKGVKALEDNFVYVIDCPEGSHSVEKHKQMGLFQTAGDSQEDKNIQFLEEMRTCIPDDVGPIFNVDAWPDLGLGRDVYYCSDPATMQVGYSHTGEGYSKTSEAGFGDGSIFVLNKWKPADMCCPKEFPYFGWLALAGNVVCCADPPGTLDDVGLRKANLVCGNIKDTSTPVKGKEPTNNKYGVVGIPNILPGQTPLYNIDSYFPMSLFSEYVCSAEKCYVSNETLNMNGQDHSTSSKLGKKCVDNYGPDLIGQYCIAGESTTKEEYDLFIELGAGPVKACLDFDSEEKEICLACFKDCPTPGTCSYSSAGCIQTTSQGITVRIFQIGLGIVGALAIVRFIQAALLRQTADPSKIQESYDIITSVVIGIVVLLGSMVILSFIGEDILQMISF